MNKPKLIRITTVPISLDKLLVGQLAFMKQYYDIIAVASDQLYLEKVGAREGVSTYCIEMSRQITPIKDLKSLWKLFRFLRREKPLFVHSHTPKAGTVGMSAAWLARVPNRLHTVAGLPLLEAKGKKRVLLNWVEKLTYACATKIYPNSYGLQDIILNEKFCKTSKLKVIGNGSSNGINTSFFNPDLYSDTQNKQLRQELSIAEDDFVFIFIGRLVRDKGINELIEVFDQLSHQYSSIKLLLVGSFESEFDPLNEKTLEIINSNTSIIYAGFQSDVRPYFAISNALAFPSYREGFPNVVMQAGAMGLPSIVTDINGCNEIVIDGCNGTIIPAHNAMALKNAMVQYISDRQLVERLQDKARQMITSRYEQIVVWKALLDEYQSIEHNHMK